MENNTDKNIDMENNADGQEINAGMERKVKIMDRICWILFGLQTLGTAILLQFLPDRIPMHFDSAGNVNRIGSKNELIFLVVLTLFIVLSFKALRKVNTEKDMKSKDEKRIAAGRTNRYIYSICGIVMVLIMVGAEASIAVNGMKNVDGINATDSISWLMMGTNLMMSLILIVFGNIMPKSRNNGTFGVRTSWSRYNDETWMRTQRASGKLGVALGFVAIFASLFLNYKIGAYVVFGLIVLWAIVSVIISYRVYKDVISHETKEKSDDEA